MNKNVLIVLAGGFVVAILVAVLVQASLGGGKKDVEEGPKTQVLVAAQDIAIGKELAVGDLKWQEWPGQPFAGAIVRKAEETPEDVIKGRMVQKVSIGQPILSTYTFKEGKGNVVAATLNKGMRAVALPVKAETMAGGFISPGDYVDVILTYDLKVERSDATIETASFLRDKVSETILKKVKILAVDQEASREQDEAKVARTVTLEVDAKGAEKLALSADMGDITLALRGIGDEADTEQSMTTDIEMSKAMQNIVRIKTGGSSGGPVRIYNGAQVLQMQPRGVVTVMGQTEQNNSGQTEAATDTSGEGLVQ